MSTQKTLSDLTPNPNNPRKITDRKLKALKKALDEFGDLSGVVFNLRSKQLIGGHQRVKVFENSHGVILTDSDGNGYIRMPNGDRFAYREVDWDENKEKAANIAANKNAGLFDAPKLQTMFKELKMAKFDMNLTMFENFEDKKKEFDETEKEYLIVCEFDNEKDQSKCFEHLQTKGIKCKIM